MGLFLHTVPGKDGNKAIPLHKNYTENINNGNSFLLHFMNSKKQRNKRWKPSAP